MSMNYRVRMKAIRGREIDIKCITRKPQMFLDLFKSSVSV